MNLLLSGRPDIGKTTTLERVADQLRDDGTTIAGFVTREIREDDGTRVGFRLVPFDGEQATLAHVDHPPPTISKYGVDLEALESVVVDTLDPDLEADIFLVDEIGKMECMSDKFIDAVRTLLDDDRPVVATVGTAGWGFMGEVEERQDTEVREIEKGNREQMPDEIVGWLRGKATS
jgi:nucleoside-triphosphatase